MTKTTTRDWKHVDGPLLVWEGCLHWLTPQERMCLFFGVITSAEIVRRRFDSKYIERNFDASVQTARRDAHVAHNEIRN